MRTNERRAEFKLAIGKVRFGNGLPLALIAGPCLLESRAHAFEMAGALKEIAARRGIGLVYKTSFDKANRTSAASARGHGTRQGAADLRRDPREARPAGAHRRARARAMRARRRGRGHLQIPAFLCRQTDLLIAAAATGGRSTSRRASSSRRGT